MRLPRPSRLQGAPLALQILGLLVGVLVVAQITTLGLTLLLPPAPRPEYSMDNIAAALRGGPMTDRAPRPLLRTTQAEPPNLQGAGWLLSQESLAELARMLNADKADVRLFFYTPLPFAGAVGVGPPPRPHTRPGVAPASFDGQAPAERDLVTAGFDPPARLIKAQFNGAASSDGPRLKRGPVRIDGFARRGPSLDGAVPDLATGGGRLSSRLIRRPQDRQPGSVLINGREAPQNTPARETQRYGVPGQITAGSAPVSRDGRAIITRAPGAPGQGLAGSGTRAGRPPAIGVNSQDPLARAVFRSGSPTMIELRPPPGASVPAKVERPAPPPLPPPAPAKAEPRPVITATPAPAGEAAPEAAPPPSLAPKSPVTESATRGRPALPEQLAPELQSRGLFGLAPVPFVAGDFVAAYQASPGQWVVVQTEPENFPNSWQRRVLLWFAISLGLIGPLGYLFARRLARPLQAFADAAEQMGRNPSAPLAPLEGPAEVGKAARAFNHMHGRLKRYVDDRAGMMAAISHDLRAPLTRMRFRLEDAPAPLRSGVLDDVQQMEEMIASFLAFMQDASGAGLRDFVDLRSLVECVIDDAAMIGGRAMIESGEDVLVEADILAIRRVMENLVGNAIKYGGEARARLFIEDGEAVVEIEDSGPGLPPEELERVFLPFHRGPAAQSGKNGIGLGLASSRSTVRAHGGDIRLLNASRGLIAQIRLPLPARTGAVKFLHAAQ